MRCGSGRRAPAGVLRFAPSGRLPAHGVRVDRVVRPACVRTGQAVVRSWCVPSSRCPPSRYVRPTVPAFVLTGPGDRPNLPGPGSRPDRPGARPTSWRTSRPTRCSPDRPERPATRPSRPETRPQRPPRVPKRGLAARSRPQQRPASRPSPHRHDRPTSTVPAGTAARQPSYVQRPQANRSRPQGARPQAQRPRPQEDATCGDRRTPSARSFSVRAES